MRLLQKSALSLALLVACLPLQRSIQAQRFTFFAYGEGSGLSNLNTTTLLQDRSGVVWAGTQSGIFTADGQHFDKQTAFTQTGFEHVRAMKEDAAGRVWVADGRHLGYWQNGALQLIANAKFHVLTHEALDLAVAPRQPEAIYFLHSGELSLVSSSDKGNTWKINQVFSSEVLTQFPELKIISSLTVDSGSSVWLGCGQFICKLDIRSGKVFRFDSQQGVPADKWTALLITHSGDIWARGEKHVIVRPANASQFQPILNLPQECFHNIRQAVLSEEPAGAILINLASGIAIGGPKGWRVLGEENGLPGDETDAIMFDRSGAAWLTSLGHGILRWYGYADWEGWNKTSGLHNNIVWGLTRDQSNGIWIATDAGLDKLDPSSNRISAQGSFNQRLFSVAIDSRHHVWTVDPTGRMLDLNPQTGRTRIAAEGLEHIFQMHIDSQQRIWACSRKGLVMFSKDDDWTQPHLVENGPKGYAWAIAEGRDGTIWVTTGDGLYRLQGDAWSSIHLPFAKGIQYNRMLAAAPDGTLWMQSKLPSPIVHLKVDGNAATLLGEVGGTEIASDNTTFVEIDQRGWLWVGSDDGLRVFNGKAWILCTAEDGLIWNDTDFHAFFADPDGSVWVGTSAGVSHLLHPEHLFDFDAPKTQLADVTLSGKQIPEGNPSYDLRRPTLSFRFLNLNYDRGPGVVAEYSLEGEENDWQETSGGVVRFPALNAGSYTLHVRAYDRRRHVRSSAVSIPFTVLEPWWKRRWSLAAEALIVLLSILGVWRLSIRLLVARQQELERLVAARTAELEKEKTALLNTRSALLEITRRDALTGLLNRTTVFECLEDLCKTARQTGSPVAIIMADLDSFKRVNDDFGHLVGDAVLRECAERIRSVTRPEDAIGRYGGEELLILLPGASVDSIRPRIEQIRLAIGDQPVRRGELALKITCSFGVAWSYGEESSIESLINDADEALYLAKQNGRNRIEYAERSFAQHSAS